MSRGPLAVTKTSAPAAFKDMLSATVAKSVDDAEYVSLWHQTTPAGSVPAGAHAPSANLHTAFATLTNGYEPSHSETLKRFRVFAVSEMHLEWG